MTGSPWLNLQTDPPERFEGRHWELNGVRYQIGRRVEGGREWQTHLLINQRSRLALHYIQLPVASGGGVRQPIVQMSLAPPRPIPGSLRLPTPSGPVLLHPMSVFVDLNSETAEAWAQVPSRGPHPPRIEAYHAVLRLNSQHSEARHALARLAVEAGVWEQALQLASECLDIEQNWLPYQLLYLRCSSALGRARLTVDCFERVAAMFPGQEPCEVGIRGYLAVGNLEGAQRALAAAPPEEADKLESAVAAEAAGHHRVRPLLEQAFQQVQSGADEAALETLARAWRIQPRVPWLRLNLALALWRAGRLYEAWSIVGPAVNLVPVPFLPRLGLHLAALSVHLGWLPNAMMLLGESTCQEVISRIRWWDDRRQISEATPRSLRAALTDLASGAVRRRAPIPTAVTALFERYGVATERFRLLAGEFQVEASLGQTALRVRGVVNGTRYFVRLVMDPQCVAGRPHHPQLLTPLFVRRVDPGWAIFFEYLGGGTLADQVQSGDLYLHRPRLRRSLEIAGRLGEALQALHATGLRHGSVSPRHVLLAEDGTPCLDFSVTPGTVSDVAGWGLCLLVMLLGRLTDPEDTANLLPGPLAEIVQGTTQSRWDDLEEPLAMVRARYLEATGEPLPVVVATPGRPISTRAADSLAAGDYVGALHFGATGAIKSSAQRHLSNLEDALRSAQEDPDPAEAALAQAAAQDTASARATLTGALQTTEPGPQRAALLAAAANVELQLESAAQATAWCEEGLTQPDLAPPLEGRLRALLGFARRDRQGLEQGLTLLDSAADSVEDRLFLADMLWALASLTEDLEGAEAAVAWYEKTASVLLELLVAQGQSEAAALLPVCFRKLALLLSELDEPTPAMEYGRRLVALRRNLAEAGSRSGPTLLAQALVTTARVLTVAGYPELAARHVAEAQTLYKEASPSPPASDLALLHLEAGRIGQQQGNIELALQHFQQGLDLLGPEGAGEARQQLLFQQANARAQARPSLTAAEPKPTQA